VTRGLSVLTALLLLAPTPAGAREGAPAAERISGIVLDPTDYYALRLSPVDLAAHLTARWRRSGVTVVYVNAYNVVYGAHYRTRHRFNRMDPLGEADFLRILIGEAHRRGIRVFASFYHHVHRGAWQANPGWRARRRDGTDYSPRAVDAQYFLSIWHPNVQEWWLGLLRELLETYPDLDGIELREPVINWWATEADYNEQAVRAFRAVHPDDPLGGKVWLRWRAAGLTAFLKRGIALIHGFGLPVHLTTVMSSWGDGRLLTAGRQAAETGFDLDGVLSGEDRPDVIKVELIWQQWGNVYDYVTFTPSWTGRAAAAALAMIAGRARTIIHVELTDFGQRRVTPEETHLAMESARRAGVSDFDVYGSKLADDKDAWPWLQRSFSGPARPVPPPVRSHTGPVRRVLVLEDEDPGGSGIPRLATSLLVNLLGHFEVLVDVRPVPQYRPGEMGEFDAVIYQGTRWDAPLPPLFLRDLDAFPGSILWIGANLWRLSRGEDVTRFGVTQNVPISQFKVNAIALAGAPLPAARPLTILGFARAPATRTLATAQAGGRLIPVAATDGRFWYVAGQLHANADDNPLHLLVAEVLHDVLRIPHAGRPQALLFVTGIHPLVDPAHLRTVADLARSTGVKPLLGVTPVFVDPVIGIRVELGERRSVVHALHALVSLGADVVQVGYTHQMRGRTGSDFEFWDAIRGMAREDDDEALVRERVNAGLRTLAASRLYPIAWATPGGLASPFDYGMFGRTFALAVERRFYGFAEGRPLQQPFPYAVWNDLHGQTVLSPNIVLGPRADVGPALAAARELVALRDALAVLSVSVDAPPSVLAQLVGRMRGMGYEFTHLRALRSASVVGDEVAIVSGMARIVLYAERGQYLRERTVGPDGAAVRTRRLRRVETSEKYEDTLRTDPDTLWVVEILNVHPWSARALALRLGSNAQVILQRWRDTPGLGRVSLVITLLLTLMSNALLLALAVTLVAFPAVYLAGRLRRRATP
jgi:uncharacterized protein YdaL